MDVTDVSADVEPLLDLVVGTQAGADTLVTGVLDDTVLIEVAEAGVEGGTVRAAVDTEAVILSKGGLVGHALPIVGLEPVGLATVLIRDCKTEGRGRVELAVGADELLASGNGIDLVPEILDHILVGLDVGLLEGHTLVVVVVVEEHRVRGLVVLGGIGDGLIVLDGTGVHAPLGVEVDDGVAAAAFLGGDEDDAGGAASAVEGCRSGVLKDGHRLDVTLGDVGKGCGIGRSVHDDERVCACVHGGDTADLDASGSGSRGAGAASHLEAGDGTDKGVGHVRGLALGDLLGFHDGRRAGEGLAGCRTESDYDGLVEGLGIRGKGHVDGPSALNRDLLGNVTDRREDEGTVGRNADGIITVCVRADTCHRPLQLDGCERNRLAVVGVRHDTRHRDVLAECQS